MDEFIMSVYRALNVGITTEQIREACLEKNYSEEEIFFGIKAGQNLYDAIVKQEEELKKRPPPFGRK